MTSRFSFPDPEERNGKEVLRRADEITIRFNMCEDGPVASYRIEGGLNQKDDEDDTARVDWQELYSLLNLIKSRTKRRGP